MAITNDTDAPLSFSTIQTEFGGSNPIQLTEYYRGGTYVPESVAVNKTATIATNASNSEIGSTNIYATSTSKSATQSSTAITSGVKTITGTDNTTAATLTPTIIGSNGSEVSTTYASTAVPVSGTNQSLWIQRDASYTFNGVTYYRCDVRFARNNSSFPNMVGSIDSYAFQNASYLGSVSTNGPTFVINGDQSVSGYDFSICLVSSLNDSRNLTSFYMIDAAGNFWRITRGAHQANFTGIKAYACTFRRVQSSLMTLTSVGSGWGNPGTLTVSGGVASSEATTTVSTVGGATTRRLGPDTVSYSYSTGTRYDYSAYNTNGFDLSVDSTSLSANGNSSNATEFSQGNTGSLSVTVTGTDPMTQNDSIPTSGNNAPIQLSDFYGSSKTSPLNA